MPIGAAELANELKSLRKGRGLQSPRLAEQVGPMLRTLSGAGDADHTEALRERLSETLRNLAEHLPNDLRMIALVALALHPDNQHQFLQERVRFLADLYHRDVRTIRRRMDEAFNRLSEIATTTCDSTAPDEGSGLGWYTGRLESIMRMDKDSPECFERRTIVAESDGLDRITTMMTVPKQAQSTDERHGLFPELYFGATLLSVHRRYGDRFSFELALPRTLQANESHEIGMILRIPHDQPMRNHYVLLPDRRCDELTVRVRFAKDGLPARVWRVADAFHRQLDEALPGEDPLPVDRSGEVCTSFRRLRPGHGYGVQWLPA